MNALSPISSLINHRRWKYRWRYLRGQTPWETDETPAEVLEFIAVNPPGKALDLGCGTGTHSLTLARHGWEVTGIEFVPGAVRVARKRAADCGLTPTFIQADVSRTVGLDGPFDFALDIGCLFTLNEKERECYARNIARLLKPGAWYMLYAWLPWMNNGCRTVGRSAAVGCALLMDA